MSQRVEQRDRFTAGDGSQQVDVRANVRTLRKDIDTLRRDVRGLASDAAAAGRHAVGSSAERARASGRRAAETAHHAQDTLNDYVSEHPTRSILAAAGIGAVLGAVLLMRRR